MRKPQKRDEKGETAQNSDVLPLSFANLTNSKKPMKSNQKCGLPIMKTP